jgi:hypothetical protein
MGQGRWEEALVATIEAGEIYRRLAEANPLIALLQGVVGKA